MSKELTDTKVFDRPFDPDAGKAGEFENCRELLPLALKYGPFQLARRNDGTQSATTNVTRRLVCHSPDGFEWGFGGSGPADLALNILAEFVPAWEAWRLHQRFKVAVIARISQKGGATIARETVAGWISDVWAYEDQVGAVPDYEMCGTIADVRGCLSGVRQTSGSVVAQNDPDTGRGSPA